MSDPIKKISAGIFLDDPTGKEAEAENIFMGGLRMSMGEFFVESGQLCQKFKPGEKEIVVCLYIPQFSNSIDEYVGPIKIGPIVWTPDFQSFF